MQTEIVNPPSPSEPLGSVSPIKRSRGSVQESALQFLHVNDPKPVSISELALFLYNSDEKAAIQKASSTLRRLVKHDKAHRTSPGKYLPGPAPKTNTSARGKAPTSSPVGSHTLTPGALLEYTGSLAGKTKFSDVHVFKEVESGALLAFLEYKL